MSRAWRVQAVVLAVVAVVVAARPARVSAAPTNLLLGVVGQASLYDGIQNIPYATDGNDSTYLNGAVLYKYYATITWTIPQAKNIGWLRIKFYSGSTTSLARRWVELLHNGQVVWAATVHPQMGGASYENEVTFQPNVVANAVRYLVDRDGNWQYVRIYEIQAAELAPDTTPPAAPTGLKAYPGDKQVRLTWSAPSDPDVDHYVIYRDGLQVATTAETSYTDTGLQNDRTYTYTVQAVDTSGNASAQSSPISVAPQAVPAAPVLRVTARTSTAIDIAWEPILNAQGLRVYRDGVLVATLPASVAIYHDSGLQPDTAYEYKVEAYNVVGASASTIQARTAPPPPPPPDPPGPPVSLGILDVGKTKVVLGWSKASGYVSGYRIYRNGVLVAVVDTQSFTDSGLLPQTRYYYQVVAFNEGGESPPAAVAVTTLAASFAETVRAGLESSIERVGDSIGSSVGSMAPWIAVVASIVTAVKLGSWFLGLWR